MPPAKDSDQQIGGFSPVFAPKPGRPWSWVSSLFLNLLTFLSMTKCCCFFKYLTSTIVNHDSYSPAFFLVLFWDQINSVIFEVDDIHHVSEAVACICFSYRHLTHHKINDLARSLTLWYSSWLGYLMPNVKDSNKHNFTTLHLGISAKGTKSCMCVDPEMWGQDCEPVFCQVDSELNSKSEAIQVSVGMRVRALWVWHLVKQWSVGIRV